MKSQGFNHDQITAVLRNLALENSDVNLYSYVDRQINNDSVHRSR